MIYVQGVIVKVPLIYNFVYHGWVDGKGVGSSCPLLQRRLTLVGRNVMFCIISCQFLSYSRLRSVIFQLFDAKGKSSLGFATS